MTTKQESVNVDRVTQIQRKMSNSSRSSISLGAESDELKVGAMSACWETCFYCPRECFKSSADFVKHLRERHCTREGGSYVCRYGFNGVCLSLPLDGVSDRDYETHVNRYHVQHQYGKETSPEWSVFSASQNLPAALNDPSAGKQSNLFTKKWGDTFVERTHIAPTPLLPEITYNDFERYLSRIGKRYKRHQRLCESASAAPSADESERMPRSPLMHENSSSSSLHTLIPDVFLKSNLNLQYAPTFAKVFPGIGRASEESKQAGRVLQEQLSHYLDVVEVKIAHQVSQKSSAFFHAMTSQDAIMSEMQQATQYVRELRGSLQRLHKMLAEDSFRILRFAQRRQNYVETLDKLCLMATVHKTQPMLQLLLGTQDYVAALDLIGTTQEILNQELIGVHCFKHLPMQLNEMEKLIDKMLTTEFERYASADLNRPLNDAQRNETDSVTTEEDKLVCIVMGLLRKGNLRFIDAYKDEAIATIRAIIKQLVIEVIANSDAELCLTGAGEEAQTCLSLCEWIALLRQATVALLTVLQRIKTVTNIMLETAAAAAGCDAASGGSGASLVVDDAFHVVMPESDGTNISATSTISTNTSTTSISTSNTAVATSTHTAAAVNLFDSEAFLTHRDYAHVQQKLQQLLELVCNYCHERCANLVSTQSLENGVATVDDIEELSAIVGDFSRACEDLCSIPSVPLKVAVKVQATRFANRFHSEHKQKLALLLDSERWRQVDIPYEFQQIIVRITEGDFRGAAINAKHRLNVKVNGRRRDDVYGDDANNDVNNAAYDAANDSINVDNNDGDNGVTDGDFNNDDDDDDDFIDDNGNNSNGNAANDNDEVVNAGVIIVHHMPQPSPVLLVEGKPFSLVGAALLFVQMLSEYCHCALRLPLVAGYLSRSVVDLLRTFNSRSCQLLIGAGALRVAGLKTITSANLALVLRALQLILWLLPKIRTHFQSLDATITATGYDTITKDMLGHIKEIENKICAIVMERIYAQLEEWNARPPIPSQSFRNISRHLVKLHEAIAPILAEEQIYGIYSALHESFKIKLRAQLLSLNIINNGGPQHGVVTSELTFYLETLRTLRALPPSELGDELLENIWNFRRS